jgi:Dimerisation domain of Ca+-activated chloride-channel, anoctamin/Calcium-activated chloride channel
MDKELVIDYVLVYESQKSAKADVRSQFENKLKQAGLILFSEEVETQDVKSGKGTRNLNFVKIHAPNDVLEEYCERLKIKMPMTISEQQFSQCNNQRPLWSFFNFAEVDSTSPRRLKSVFSKAKREMYVWVVLANDSSNWNDFFFRFATEEDDFFTPTIRIEVINYILNKTSLLGGPDGSEGGSNIQKLLVDKVYTAAYPLHDGNSSKSKNARAELNREWATLKKWNREQPLDKIKEYFGVQVGLYFAWLGFYTKMLVPLAFVGVVCFIYGFIEVFTDPIK